MNNTSLSPAHHRQWGAYTWGHVASLTRGLQSPECVEQVFLQTPFPLSTTSARSVNLFVGLCSVFSYLYTLMSRISCQEAFHMSRVSAWTMQVSIQTHGFDVRSYPKSLEWVVCSTLTSRRIQSEDWIQVSGASCRRDTIAVTEVKAALTSVTVFH